jgi:hypothetical protein
MIGAANYTESRWSQRRAAALPVELVVGGARWADAKTRDVGLGGVFIEIAGNQPVLGSDIDIFFLLQQAGNPARYRLRARVVRKADDGIGVMFRDFDTHAFRTLQEVMRQAPVGLAAIS